MDARLYVIPASHPAMTAQLMLEHKGIPYKRTDLMPVISKGVLQALRFPGVTVPALKIDGRKVQGSREIARELDRAAARAAALPRRPRGAHRGRGGRALRRRGPAARRSAASSGTSLKRDRSPLRSYSEGAKLGIPIGLAVKTAAPIVALAARFNEATDENVRRDLAALPGMLQRIDDWIAAGVLGGEQLNAADFQIAPSLRLAMTLEDLRPAIEDRPAGAAGDARRPRLPRPTPRRSCRPPGCSRCAASRPPPPSQRGPTRSTRSPFRRAPRARRRGASRRAGSARGRARAAARGRSGGWSPRGAGGVSRSVSQLEVAEQQQVDVERPRAVAGAAERSGRCSTSIALQSVEQRLGLELGADPRAAALRKSGWSRISPTGSVS